MLMLLLPLAGLHQQYRAGLNEAVFFLEQRMLDEDSLPSLQGKRRREGMAKKYIGAFRC